MTTRSKEYYQFMKQIAERYRLIAHSEQQAHFFRGELEEFYVGLRNRVNFPALVVEGFNLSYSDTVKRRETSFIIAQSYTEQDDYDQLEEVFDLCERIGDEVVRYLGEYFSECARITNITAAQLENESEKYCALRYTFDIEMPFYQDLNADDWDEQD
jgi:hypothetical protein